MNTVCHLNFQRANDKRADQTKRMQSLVCVLVVEMKKVRVSRVGVYMDKEV